MSAPYGSACHRTIWWWLDAGELAARGGPAGYLDAVFGRPMGRWCRENGYAPTGVRWKRIAADEPGVWQVGVRLDLAEGALDAAGLAVLLDPAAPHFDGFFDLRGRAIAGRSMAEAA